MKSKEFIINELKEFILKFSNMRIRYEFDEISFVHTVEVLPNEKYHSDQLYMEWESDMFDRFTERFPYENICFVSDDAVYGITNEALVIEGVWYYPITRQYDPRVVEYNTIIKAPTTSISSGFTSFTTSKPCVAVEVNVQDETKLKDTVLAA
ncbi:MAG: hypothetical protein ACRC3Z_06360 [Phocaeicola sp.]